jgi:hypothetical protein
MEEGGGRTRANRRAVAGHAHAPHAGGHHESGPEVHVWRFRLELVIAILLGAAAIVGALAAYTGHVSEGHAVRKYNEAVQSVSDANLFYNQGNQRLISDQAIFLEYVKALIANNDSIAAYIQTTLMSDNLKKMVDWWETGKNTDKYDSPFVDADPYYSIDEYAKGAELDKQTKERFKEGRLDEGKSNRYTLVEVLVTSALFLYGVASVTRRVSIKLGFLAFGFLLFSLSLAQFLRVRYG